MAAAKEFTQAELSALLKKLNDARSKRNPPQAALKMEADGVHVALENGALATWEPAVSEKTGKSYAKWVIVQGAPKSYLDRVRTPKGQKQQGKPLSLEKATKAFNQYYARRDYKSDAAMDAAIKRDMEYSPSHKGQVDKDRIWKSTRYLRNPGKLDYPGLDDGAKISKNSGKGNPAALAKWRAAHPKGSPELKHFKKSKKNPDGTRRSKRQVLTQIKRRPRKSKRAQAGGEGSEEELSQSSEGSSQQSGGEWSEEELSQSSSQESSVSSEQQQQQTGGRAVSLKTAVRLLRNYYSNRYQK